MRLASPFVTALPMFAIDVPTPPAAVSACSWKLAKPLPPSVSRRTSVDRNSSIETSPFFRASYSSMAPASAPSMDFATWSSCPGIAVCTLRHSSSSNLPRETAWLNCSMAAFCISMGLLPATSASLNASMMSVDFPTSLIAGTMR